MDTVVVMGVSGAGKTTVARALAARCGADFVEGDRLHPPRNLERMAAGIPLTDRDRQPWLDAVAAAIEQHREDGRRLVVSCSALRRTYRDRLREVGPVRFVFLDPARAELERRLAERTHEFMPAELLDSQVLTLERPDEEPDVITVEPDGTVGATVSRVVDLLELDR